ncbi:MAG: hypothetical protein ACK5RO_12295 [Pseudobdellovibrionaceae bacterium]
MILFSTSASWALPRTNSLEMARNQLENWREELENATQLPPRERDLRREFVYRLRFLLQTPDWESKIQQEAKRENWPVLFRTQLEQALKEDLEPQQNIVLFLRDLIEKISISNTDAQLTDFQNSRSYFNGKKSLEAEPLDLESAGDEAALILENKETQTFPEWYQPISPTLTP